MLIIVTIITVRVYRREGFKNMKNLDKIIKYDAIGQLKLLQEGHISPLELTTFYIERIKVVNPILNAIVHTSFEDALQQAKKENAGTFAGMPFLVKDLNFIKGYPSTSGSRMLEHYIAPEDDVYVERYRHAGLNFLGKTNTPEFGFLPTTEPDLFGPTKNPWDLERSPGGSSGGAAAAVASGMAPFAHASDGGGSIRIPASACGLVGFKPSRGQVPHSMYMDNLAVNHALTRSVRDSAALLDVIHGGNENELSPSYEKGSSFLLSTNESPPKLKIAVTPDWGGRVEIDDETRKSFLSSVKLLEELGHSVEYASPEFDFTGMAESFIKVWAGAGAVVMNHMGAMDQVSPNQENVEPLSYNIIQEGLRLSAYEYEEARIKLQMEAKKIVSFHQTFDIVMTPVLNKLPAQLGSFKQVMPVAMYNNFRDYCSFTPIANVTGQPSVSVPLYWTENNIPIGTQFTGRPGEDRVLFKLASQLEQAKPWFHQYEKLDYLMK